MTSAIALHHVYQRFGDHLAVNDLNLTVEPGECFGLLGPNGAGKTTTIRLINTLLPVQDGEVLVFGGTFETLGYLAAYYVSLLLHVLKFPGRTFRQFFPTVGHAIDRRAGWTTSTSALHTLAFDLLYVGHGADGPIARPRPATVSGTALDPEPWAPAP